MSLPRASHCVAALVLPLALLASVPCSSGTRVVRWTDDQGHAQHTDVSKQVVDDGATRDASVPAADPSAFVDLETRSVGDATDVWVGNELAGPVQVRLQLPGRADLRLSDDFHLDSMLPPTQRVRLGRVYSADNFDLLLDIVPGDPMAQPRDVAYSLPVDENSHWEIGQAFGGGHSHSDVQNRYAVDLIVPEGTPVLAARPGVVMQAESGFDGGGNDRARYASRANLIRVLHDDGTMAVYAHLQTNGVFVRVGERVGIGQQIGLSGNTGYSSGPHLHFCVQVNRGMLLTSIPFRMVGPSGFLPLQ